MRTTLDLNDDLLAEAKALAARDKLSLTRLIEEGLAMRLRLPKQGSGATNRKPLPVHLGIGGLSTSVKDPRSNCALFDAADGLTAP